MYTDNMQNEMDKWWEASRAAPGDRWETPNPSDYDYKITLTSGLRQSQQQIEQAVHAHALSTKILGFPRPISE
jgi:hypothetical protein